MLYTELKKSEKKEWCQRFITFSIEQLPILLNSKDCWKPELDAVTKEALELINAYPTAQEFVKESLYYEDYSRRISAINLYFDQIKVALADDLKAITEDDTEKKPVGRPHNEKPESKEPPVEQKELFEDSDFKEENIAPQTTDQFLSLNQLKWLLSDNLSAAVDDIKNIRAVAAREAEIAKQKALDHASKTVIAEHAQAAHDNTERYEQIYQAVDKELATVYLQLKEDEQFIKAFQQKWKTNNLEDLKERLKPYFKKMDDKFIMAVREMIANNNPEVVAKKAAEEALKKKKADIIKYLTRKDKPNTDKRIAGIKKKLTELEKLCGKEEADIYAPFLTAAIEDFKAKNSDKPEVIPKKQAKKIKK
jgi:hypothetical protein